jgi:cytochrome P450
MTLSQAVYDLASKPEYIKMLREEIQHVIAEDGQDVDGEGFVKLKKTSFAKLRKLDSFVKESQRLAPLDISKSSSQPSFREPS